MKKIYAVIIIVSILLSYNIISYYFISNKSQYVIPNKLKFRKYSNFKMINKYFEKVSQTIHNLGNPFFLTIRRYIFCKYILSTGLFLILFFRDGAILMSIICFVILFIIPDLLLSLFKKSESTKIIKEISNIVQNQILSLSAGMSTYESLKCSITCIRYARFKIEFEKFTNDYQMYNFNIIKPIEEIKEKFKSYEIDMYLSILMQGQKEGNMLEILESFNSSLEVMYFKYLKYKSSQRVMIVSLATIISLLNSFAVVMYPIGVQISQNLGEIFK